MLVPGLSGGTTAILLGVYDKAVCAAAGLVKNFGRSALALAPLFSGIVKFAVEKAYFFAMFFFCGAVAGGVPALIRKAGRQNPFYTAFWVLAGFAFCLPLGFLPAGALVFSGTPGLFFAGLLLAAALILPGISVSYMLLVFGLYEDTLAALSGVDLTFLLSLGLGLGMGTVLLAGFLKKAMEKRRAAVYPLTAGFVLGALLEVFPGLPPLNYLPLCVCLAAAGLYMALRFSFYTYQ